MQSSMKSAVSLEGSLNKAQGSPDHGWTVEVALPIAKLMEKNADPAQTPKPGVFWRINFSRVQWALEVKDGKYVKKASCQSCPKPGEKTEDNWVWSPQGVVNMHNPETWGIVQFGESDGAVPEGSSYKEWPARSLARVLYDAQHAWKKKAGGEKKFTDDIAALNAVSEPQGALAACGRDVDIELGTDLASFTASLGSKVGPASLTARVTDQRRTTVAWRPGTSGPRTSGAGRLGADLWCLAFLPFLPFLLLPRGW